MTRARAAYRAGAAQVAKSALVLGDYGLPHHAIARSGALFAMQDMPWDHGLTVTADGAGLVGHAGGVMLRKIADRSGPDRGAERRAGQGRAVPAGGPRDGDGVGGGDDRAGRRRDERHRGAGPPRPGAGRAGRPGRRCAGRWTWPIRPRWTRSRRPGRGSGRTCGTWSRERRPGGFPWPVIAGRVLAGWTGHRHGRHADHRALLLRLIHVPDGGSRLFPRSEPCSRCVADVKERSLIVRWHLDY